MIRSVLMTRGRIIMLPTFFPLILLVLTYSSNSFKITSSIINRTPNTPNHLAEEWIPLTRSLIKKLGISVWKRLEKQGYSGRALASLFWAEMGLIFEEAVLQSLEMDSNLEEFNGTVPDAVGRILNGKLWQGWPRAVFIEVKISTLIPTRERDRLQILRMIEYLEQVRERVDVVPALILVTPAGGFIREELVLAATHAKVALLHAEIQTNHLNQKVIRVGPAKSINKITLGIPFLSILRNGHSRPTGLNL